MQMSFEDLQQKLSDAIAAAFGVSVDSPESWRYYVIDTFDTYVVARADEKTYQIPYTVDDAENVQLGTPTEVEEVYVPVQQAATFAPDATATDNTVYEVVVMKAGLTSGKATIAGEKQTLRQYFPEGVVAQVAAALNGARFGRRHPSDGEHEAAQPELVAGWFDNGHMVGDEARGTLHLLPSETDLIAKLQAARQTGKLDLFGLSVLAYFGFKISTVNGEKVLEATSLGKLARVDWVAEPAAGGRFLGGAKVAASKDMLAEISRLQKTAAKGSSAESGEINGGRQAGRNKGAAMKDSIIKLLAALRKHDAGKAAELETEFAQVKDEGHAEFLGKVTAAIEGFKPAAAAAAASANAGTATTEPAEVLRSAQALMDDAKKIQSANIVNVKLSAAKLPVPAQDLVRKHLEGRIVTEAEVDAEITSVRTAFAAFSNTGRVTDATRVGLESVDKIALAMDAMFGVKAALSAGTKPFRGLQEAYVVVTGDSDLSFSKGGGFMRVTEAVATGDFPNLLLDSVNKRIIQDYAEVGMGGLDQLFTVTPGGLKDFKAQNRVRMGYLPDLATVAQNAPYVEFAKPTDDLITFAATKRGNIVTISRETIINDDLGAIMKYPSRIARAARRTLKQFVTTFLTGNPNYDPDGVAVFHATHGNLGSAALTIDELVQRELALNLQTEKDSNKPLGLQLTWLAVPPALWATAWKINNAEFFNPGPAINEPNPFYKRFGQNNERLIKNELFTDANDWYCGSDPNDVPLLEIGFIGDVREPQLFINNDPSNGSVGFTNDQIQYKVRHEYGGDFVDFRSAQKNVVA
jgi:hypothetical protein